MPDSPKPKLTVDREEYRIMIPRALWLNSRLDRTILAALAQALSSEGLQEAIDYFANEAANRGRPSAIQQLIEQKQKLEPESDPD